MDTRTTGRLFLVDHFLWTIFGHSSGPLVKWDFLVEIKNPQLLYRVSPHSLEKSTWLKNIFLPKKQNLRKARVHLMTSFFFVFLSFRKSSQINSDSCWLVLIFIFCSKICILVSHYDIRWEVKTPQRLRVVERRSVGPESSPPGGKVKHGLLSMEEMYSPSKRLVFYRSVR